MKRGRGREAEGSCEPQPGSCSALEGLDFVLKGARVSHPWVLEFKQIVSEAGDGKAGR